MGDELLRLFDWLVGVLWLVRCRGIIFFVKKLGESLVD